MTVTSSPIITNTELTQDDIEKATRSLCETRDALVEATAGLSPSQWEFKPAADCWSVAEIVEHVALIEERVKLLIGKMGDAPAPEPDWDRARLDDLIPREIPKRTSRVQAPPHVLPTGRWSGPEAVEQFIQKREHTIGLLAAPALRGHVLPHPIFGPWDGYQWILATGAHSARHTGQILEVRTSPHWPL